MIKPLNRLLYALIFLSLTACGAADEETPANAEAPTSASAAAQVESPVVESQPGYAPDLDEEPTIINGPGKAWTGDLDTMAERRVVRMLTVYGTGRYWLDDGQEKGIAKEMATRFEAFINKRLKRGEIKVQVAIIPVARNQLIPSLLAGRGDVINAGLSITPERQKSIAFSIPASKPISEILVTGPSAQALTSIDDLSGKSIPIRHSSSYRESVEALSQRFVKEGKEPITIQPVSELLEDDDLIEMVNQGLLDWAIVDDYKLDLWDGVFKDLKGREDIVFREGGRTAWGFRKDSPLLADTVNAFLKKNREGTLIGNIMKNRYVRDFDWAANAMASADFQRFQDLEALFIKYGEQYEVDYLIAAAQGYQESRLNQSARSGAGAIGIMQLLPTTAADKSVGIDNIHDAESNIHAGIKYLNYLRTRYFSDPDIVPPNQTLLALAAYNAGPGRMIKMRRTAKNQGYDPNVWFDNVELVAAQEIGRETLQYVSNIYKYYVAYRYSIELQARREQARERAMGNP